VEELAAPGATFAIVFGSAVSTKLASVILGKGANVAGWVPQGLSRFHLPGVLKKAFEEGNLVLFSIAKAGQGWNPTLASQSTLATLLSSKANLITDPEPKWLNYLMKDAHMENGRNFYINYQSTSPQMLAQWSALAAQPIKRKSADGRPNLARIIDRIRDHKFSESHQSAI
jgi:hypothetical protein